MTVEIQRKVREMDKGTIKLIIAIVGVTTLLTANAVMAKADRMEPDAYTQQVEVGRFDGSPNRGTATLVRHEDRVEAVVSTKVGGEQFVVDLDDPPGGFNGSHWQVGDATTLWWVLFNRPDNCVDGCGVDEVISAMTGDNFAGVGLFYGSGSVAHTGHWNTAATLAVDDTTGLTFGEPLAAGTETEVHLVVRTHGPARDLSPVDLAAALTSFGGGCDTNTCGDTQDAVFAPIDD